MNHEQIDAMARQAGCVPEAVPDIRARVLARFQEATPSLEAVERWLSTTLREAAPHLFGKVEVWEKLGMDKATFDAMPPSWRLGQGMAQQARTTTPHPRRPVYRNLMPAELDSIKDLPFHERTTRGREMQQTPHPGQG
jgi:hypothetical protein